jgi:hypothetical protein
MHLQEDLLPATAALPASSAAVIVEQHVVGLEEDVISQEFVEEEVGICG